MTDRPWMVLRLPGEVAAFAHGIEKAAINVAKYAIDPIGHPIGHPLTATGVGNARTRTCASVAQGPLEAVSCRSLKLEIPPIQTPKAKIEAAKGISRLLLQRRVLIGALIPAAILVLLLVVARADDSAVVPNLVGTRVDPQLDRLRVQLEVAGLALDDTSVEPCPKLGLPGSSLESLPGTIIEQHSDPGTTANLRQRCRCDGLSPLLIVP